ncbi:MAG: hypothetical protein A3I71_04585 [Omnitrophica WOR_2 bacterium RIFCSPLOWO2_02_FULL_63_16]|nr:MAG: hypothetical protein A3I71_04585 [Omnitrophica WOR_2 bacterium RIFCSPLOWO2_02_FULL_63_16]OGX48781.1 MAG: hypothetical protein A3G88_06025 [Omnitrophica WOR_2 bacterium RIFCSPLOWO2_12_FULL_63_16]
MNRRGASLIEVLVAIIIIVIASVGTLAYFAYGLGNVGKTGNRRAALERSRERLEQLMASTIANLPSRDGNCYACAEATCTAASWATYPCGAAPPSDTIPVEDQGNLRRETFAQFVEDPAAGTTDDLDVYEFGVKVWFTNTATDDDFHRVHLQTLRTP